jgi:hypothetical protein
MLTECFTTSHDSTYNWETQIGTVRTSLIPSLDSSADRADDDREVERQRVAPAMSSFEPESLTLGLGQSLDMFITCRVLRNQGTSLDQIDTFRKAFFVAKHLNIVHQIRVRDVCQRVGDP